MWNNSRSVNTCTTQRTMEAIFIHLDSMCYVWSESFGSQLEAGLGCSNAPHPSTISSPLYTNMTEMKHKDSHWERGVSLKIIRTTIQWSSPNMKSLSACSHRKATFQALLDCPEIIIIIQKDSPVTCSQQLISHRHLVVVCSESEQLMLHNTFPKVGGSSREADEWVS